LQEEFDRYQREAFPPRGANFFALELNGEAGELANLEKKAWKGKKIDPADFADEAADVLIALLNYANSRQIDLPERPSERCNGSTSGASPRMANNVTQTNVIFSR
jgi:NTP pyrophosphatase (non-canonical NTP hydrolase)